MDVRIKSGNTKVIASGTVISYNNNPIEISFGLGGNALKLIFDFKNDKKQNERRIEAKQLGNNELKILLLNFNNLLGTGTAKPILIGTLSGKKISINFKVQDNDKTSKTLHYTIYLGEEVAANG